MTFEVMRKPPAEPAADGTSVFVIEDDLGLLASLAARLFVKALGSRIAEYGVSAGQWPLLIQLWERDGLTQKELSRRVRIEEPTTARTLERMERRGLVRRERGRVDRREMRVFLTERGRELRDELIPCAQEINARATHGLSADDKARAASLLRYLIARLG